jgi:hypothetical protein
MSLQRLGFGGGFHPTFTRRNHPFHPIRMMRVDIAVQESSVRVDGQDRVSSSSKGGPLAFGPFTAILLGFEHHDPRSR